MRKLISYGSICIVVIMMIILMLERQLTQEIIESSQKKYDVVLIHGFSNRYQWGDSFLKKLVTAWGSHRVFIIYINSSYRIYTRSIDKKKVIYIGENDSTAGNQTIKEQEEIISKKIQYLKEKQGLSYHMNMIAHSSGGLVARRYVYFHPRIVTNLVTLGTPHHGTPLVDDYKWLMNFIGGKKALLNLKPTWVEEFNHKYPIKENQFFNQGHLYTISGHASSWINRGQIGELTIGWTWFKFKYGVESDGIVKEGEAAINGAIHLETFDQIDHFNLIRDETIADCAIQVLN